MSRTQEIKDILDQVKYASMATVNPDGSPHNSPLVFLYDPELTHVFWSSDPDSLHSQNVFRTGQAFFTVFDSQAGGTGLYIQATKGKVVSGDELHQALEIHNHFATAMVKNQLILSTIPVVARKKCGEPMSKTSGSTLINEMMMAH